MEHGAGRLLRHRMGHPWSPNSQAPLLRLQLVVELEVPLLDGIAARLLEFVVLVDCLGRDDEGRDVQGYPVSEAVAPKTPKMELAFSH